MRPHIRWRFTASDAGREFALARRWDVALQHDACCGSVTRPVFLRDCGRSFATWVRAPCLPKAGAQQDDVEAVAALLRSNPSMCHAVAASVDTRAADEWAASRRKLAIKAEHESAHPVAPLSRKQWVRLFGFNALPFIGFGFFDNTIMLTVGETIDMTVGVAFGLSTLASAGMGQCVSDACGITLQGLIERFADRLGLPNPRLTRAQYELSSVRSFIVASRILGIIMGCLLGMWPLMFMDARDKHLVGTFFGAMSANDRHELQKVSVTESFEAGETFLKHNEVNTHLFIIERGEVEVLGRDADGQPFIVSTITPGHTFGNPHVQAPYCDLVTKTPARVMCIPKADFLRITTGTADAEEIFKEALVSEVEVYRQASRSATWKAEKGTGKTRFFAFLSSQEKLEVLACTNLDEVQRFRGTANEGKTAFFTRLTEEQKQRALLQWSDNKIITKPPMEADVIA